VSISLFLSNSWIIKVFKHHKLCRTDQTLLV
jgi:hypothetical protein